MRLIRSIFIFVWFLAGAVGYANAQFTTIYTHKDADYQEALNLFEKEKYAVAQQLFLKVMNQIQDVESEVRVNAEYFAAVCALELFHNDAEALLIKFIDHYPESPNTRVAYYQLGIYKFRKKEYDEVIKWFDRIDIYDLNQEQLSEYYFKKGYSHYQLKQNKQAAAAFYEIKDADSKYSSAALYYYAHIAYEEGKYQTAYNDFKKIENDPKFAGIVPYYITQIFYLQEKYEELIEYAPSILDSIPNSQRAPEIARLIGESYYRTEKYTEAIPYLEKYYSKRSSKSDVYQLGYAYFKSGNYEKAIEWLQESALGDDSIAQISNYNLAECYLKVDKKRFAKGAFKNAANYSYDEDVKEDALFSYAKLSYELASHPYNDAIKAFEEYIQAYPNSKRLNESYEYLVGVYFTTKNYKAALESLDQLKDKSKKLCMAYQRVAYYRALELFKDGQYATAIGDFDKSLKFSYRKDIYAAAIFWKAEAHYRIEQYQEAIDYFKEFLNASQAILLEFYHDASYNIGYGYFQLKQYSEAANWFRKYTNSEGKREVKESDAYNRIGDCYYVNENYDFAIDFYNKAVKLGKRDPDYAMLQSAICSGVLEDQNTKAELLEKLTKGNPTSDYYDDGVYELGKAYLKLNKEPEALVCFDKIISDFPGSSYLKGAMLKKGRVHYNLKDEGAALTILKRLVDEYQESSEAKDALVMIKQIYEGKDNVESIDEFAEYASKVPIANISQASLDSAAFEIALNSYAKNDCEKAVNNFTAYLEKREKPLFVLEAHYYRADCEYKSAFYDEALLDYKFIIEKPKSDFTEDALLKLGWIYKKLENKEKAFETYVLLEEITELPTNKMLAIEEQLELTFALGKFDAVKPLAQKLIQHEKTNLTSREKAHLLTGKAAMQLKDYITARLEFGPLSGLKSVVGAEAKYNLSYIFFIEEKYDSCEASITEMLDNTPSQDYWVAKGFLLMADNFEAKKDDFQAKYTLQLVLDNAKDKGLLEMAQQKLDEIKERELKSEEEKKQQELEINMSTEEKGNDEQLFKEEE